MQWTGFRPLRQVSLCCVQMPCRAYGRSEIDPNTGFSRPESQQSHPSSWMEWDSSPPRPPQHDTPTRIERGTSPPSMQWQPSPSPLRHPLSQRGAMQWQPSFQPFPVPPTSSPLPQPPQSQFDAGLPVSDLQKNDEDEGWMEWDSSPPKPPRRVVADGPSFTRPQTSLPLPKPSKKGEPVLCAHVIAKLTH